ncbi:pilus assembly protein [Streptomyces sp. NBC_00237]|uniref:TadE/TadG family type IV pilus assembly protein n=1 Tax=Streptomyces sp. NBC_00237 TaxID=2975687 RepID=UPI002250A18D|nr:TadE/TadG family type IV pilus assembly protein [Streptomyces sp. NBC_00237]MCX5204537.1 pilus assembly protein [Streptomyces sp. NBC_00237]
MPAGKRVEPRKPRTSRQLRKHQQYVPLLRQRVTGPDRDQGVTALEFAGFLPILLVVAVAVIQLGIVGYAAQQASTAARAAARTESQKEFRGQGEAAGRAAISGWLADGTTFAQQGEDIVTVTATVQIPALIPIFDLGSVSRPASMPADSDR